MEKDHLPEERGLPAPARAGHREDLAAPHREAHAVVDHGGPEARADVGHLDDGLRSAREVGHDQIPMRLKATENSASRMMTRNTDWTTLTVVRRPTLSASPFVWSPW